MNKDINPTEYQSSDENIPDRITEDERRQRRRMINDTIVWDIRSWPMSGYPMGHDYSFYSYDSEGKPRCYITQSAHQSVPYYLSDGDTLDIGYEDIKEYLSANK